MFPLNPQLQNKVTIRSITLRQETIVLSHGTTDGYGSENTYIRYFLKCLT